MVCILSRPRPLHVQFYSDQTHALKRSLAGRYVSELLCRHRGGTLDMWLPAELGEQLYVSLTLSFFARSLVAPADAPDEQLARAAALKTLCTRRHT